MEGTKRYDKILEKIHVEEIVCQLFVVKAVDCRGKPSNTASARSGIRKTCSHAQASIKLQSKKINLPSNTCYQ